MPVLVRTKLCDFRGLEEHCPGYPKAHIPHRYQRSPRCAKLEESQLSADFGTTTLPSTDIHMVG